jgi:hypothetical protein
MAANLILRYETDLHHGWRRAIGHSAWSLLMFPLWFSEHKYRTANQFWHYSVSRKCSVDFMMCNSGRSSAPPVEDGIPKPKRKSDTFLIDMCNHQS